MRRKLTFFTSVVLLVLFIGFHLTFIGCQLTPKPVTLSPKFRVQVQSAVTIIEVLEARFAVAHDPNDCKAAMQAAKDALQNVLDADAGGD